MNFVRRWIADARGALAAAIDPEMCRHARMWIHVDHEAWHACR